MSTDVVGAATQIIVMAIVISLILLFLGIGVLVIIHVCIVGRAFRGGFGNGRMVERGNPRSTSMSLDDLDKLPCFHFQAKEKGSSSPVDCAVCLDNFKMGDKCRLLPLCNHSFHAQCVDSWLLKTPICPICRTSADFRKGSLVSGEESSHFSDTGNELRESQTTERSHMGDVGIDSRDNPGAVTGIQLSSNHSPNNPAAELAA
ncbi:putative RING-H2 finger protein ATL49 [Vitis vinifera]|uniref:RING-type E3 ubiquitin transferase n=1 Tax=Vitis vinifera TaxID=29760 RepID=A0A438JIH1_VITVI|nr:putative RING-H2 finger protein ATL49 [Vitis vinifera]